MAAPQPPTPPAGLSGLELLRAGMHRTGGLAGMGKTLNFRLVDVEEGRAIFEGEATDQMLNPLGMVHGGWALALIDSATGCAAHTTLAAGVGYTTLETKVNFTRAITPQTGRVRVEGNVIVRGRQIITADAKVTDEAGRVLAHGTSTLLVLGAQSPPQPAPKES